MSHNIERFDRQRRKIRGWHLLGFSVFFMAWIIRSILKTIGIPSETGFTILMIVLLLSICWMGYFAVRIVLIDHKIKRDPILREALYNELVRLNELKSWKIAFFSLIFFNLIAGYLIISVPIRDPMVLIVTSLLVGFGSFNLSVYFLDR